MTIKSVFVKKEPKCVFYSCKTCSKVYKQNQTKQAHEKKCTGAKTVRDDIEYEKIKIIALEEQQAVLELKIKLMEMKKMDKNTFRAVNKVLME